jgi:Domain of unknown function (DUF1772)
MFIFIIRFFDILFSGLLAGIMICVWQGADHNATSEISNLEIQQANIKIFNDKIPLLGLITILLTLTSAILQNQIMIIFIPLLIAFLFLIVSGIITRYGNQPINKQIQRWSKDFIPSKWEYIRDKWFSFHIYRTILTVLAFVLITLACLIN